MLGKGTFGTVMKVDLEGSKVACKTIPADAASREVEICTILMRNAHPNIVAILKVESTPREDMIYMNMYPSDLRKLLTLLSSKNCRIKEKNAMKVVIIALNTCVFVYLVAFDRCVAWRTP